MKKLILPLLILGLALTSCKKDNPKPITTNITQIDSSRQVTIDVWTASDTSLRWISLLYMNTFERNCQNTTWIVNSDTIYNSNKSSFWEDLMNQNLKIGDTVSVQCDGWMPMVNKHCYTYVRITNKKTGQFVTDEGFKPIHIGIRLN